MLPFLERTEVILYPSGRLFRGTQSFCSFSWLLCRCCDTLGVDFEFSACPALGMCDRWAALHSDWNASEVFG